MTLRRQHLTRAGGRSLFAVGFALASIGLILLAFLSMSRDADENSRQLYALIFGNGALILVLLSAAGIRVVRKFMGRRFGEPAPRLHIRFIILFSVAAITPAVLTAGFNALVLGRGMEFWLGEPVNTLVESVADLGREQAPEELELARIQMRSMANDLSQGEAVEALRSNRIVYSAYLREQAIRRNFQAAYIVDSQSTILARAEAQNAPLFTAPSPRLFQILGDTEIAVSDPVTRDDAPDFVRLLLELPAYEDAYLYVVWYHDFSLLTQTEQATAAFRDAVAAEEQTRRLFFFVYVEAAMLILAGAIWLALSAANQVVAPVGRLVSAAERVRRGDLDARVEVAGNPDELAALGRAFNRMTRQLNSQRSTLLEVNAEAERRRAFIEAVLTGVSAGVIGVDSDGRITLMNRSAATLLGLEPGDVVGETVDTAAPVFAAVVEEAARRPSDIAERQIDLTGADGALVHLNARAALDDDGGMVITFDDVTRLVAAQRNAAWRDVARRIAHEIKNPLTPIQLSAERLRRKYRKDVDQTQVDVFDRCVDTIVRQVSDIGRMVDEFSTFARMPAPKMEVTDLNVVAEGAVFAQRVASPQIRISLQRPDDAVMVECDSRLATQSLANILKNAAESVSTRMESEAGKSIGQMQVSVLVQDGFAIIEVKDDGLGWPSPDKARLTEPYMTTREKGTGLGLAIVRRVMEDHSGRLELHDRDDSQQGAVVRLAFPLLDNNGSLPNRAESAQV
ncbi:sensor histidine kinase [Marinicauda sp. Alg238-R41]|uniref:sensor histidine kinase n=1 Tax=Marinicauda sp. Alg238-R41 TaxID=2993447 RepID=UPI0022E0D74A|nr:PAS domain-containing sensor histidine kinase [Marinicauda sp. Alg238-R41]